jgi:hypothetical protein
MNKFIAASANERLHLKNIEPIFKSKIEYTADDGYDVYDMTITNTKKYILEAKCRLAYYVEGQYNKEQKIYPDIMLECKKWRDLKAEAQKTNSEILYISFALNTTIIYNITKLMQTHPELFQSCVYRNCPKQTMGDTTAKNKPVFLLPITLGKIINYKIDAYNK